MPTHAHAAAADFPDDAEVAEDASDGVVGGRRRSDARHGGVAGSGQLAKHFQRWTNGLELVGIVGMVVGNGRPVDRGAGLQPLGQLLDESAERGIHRGRRGAILPNQRLERSMRASSRVTLRRLART